MALPPHFPGAIPTYRALGVTYELLAAVTG